MMTWLETAVLAAAFALLIAGAPSAGTDFSAASGRASVEFLECARTHGT